jgi:hypothetical protein
VLATPDRLPVCIMALGVPERHGGLTSHLLLLRGRELDAFYPVCR